VPSPRAWGQARPPFEADRLDPDASPTRTARSRWFLVAILIGLAAGVCTSLAADPRTVIRLDDGWRTTLASDLRAGEQPESVAFDDTRWRTVDIPHNWDAYEGARQTRHGNRHGSAWYRREFAVTPDDTRDGRRVFLFFEGVGSYATVWVNGREVGRHAGGLTTFTVDVTAAVHVGADNRLVVRADHPSGIRDLPWVCGGCELVYGFSEGPQPFGLFRPVSLIVTAGVRVEPFGVHVWADPGADATGATLHVRTELRNYGPAARSFTLATRVHDGDGASVIDSHQDVTLAPGETRTVERHPLVVLRPRLWSPAQPHLYTATTEVLDGDAVLDRETTTFGIRTVQWPDPEGPPDRPLLINGEPVFLNGTCDYEHNLGANHAFSDAQVAARGAQIHAAGFNAFRDAHHPHNLRFNAIWDRAGTLWWTQFGAQIWFDRDDFRANYTRLLRQWVKERRNSPSLILYGLQNESKLPAAFAAECAAIIREMDPTASTERLITTCNGGTGTDWNVPQNWTGTYGGDPLTYADDLRRQRLVGEYGAWRSLGLHREPDPTVPASPADPSRFAAFAAGPNSEERLNALLETKIRLADTVRDRVVGHFHWPFTTHANPGRNFGENGEQLHDGFRPLDRVGPANNKGLFTLWGEPTDAYHLYRANFTDPRRNPMVAIMSRTWPDRWTTPGRKSGIVVYSNCEEVELFNDLGDRSLGVRRRAGPGTHFRWDDVPIEFDLLRAEARVGGAVVARDAILLHHLPPAPRYAAADAMEADLLAPVAGSVYLHRINCGGPEYRDHHGRLWVTDRGFASSWADDYTHLPPEFASQRRIHEPIAGTRDDALFQTFRHGRDRLRFAFSVPAGAYEVDLFLTEPWYGAGGERDCTGWRRFDIMINGSVAASGVDPWAHGREHARALKLTVPVDAKTGTIEVGFRVDAGQAVISAIAVRTRPGAPPPAASAPPPASSALHTHLDLGDRIHLDAETTLAALPASLLESDLIRTTTSGAIPAPYRATRDVHVTVAHDTRVTHKPAWLASWSRTGEQAATAGPQAARFDLFRRVAPAGSVIAFGPNQDVEGDGPAAMYFVILEPARPLPAPQFVEALTVSGGAPWSAHGHLKSGLPHYTDTDARFTSIPAAFGDGDWLRPPAGGPDSVSASFTASVPIEVAIGLDARIASRPSWLDAWIPTPWTLGSTQADAARFSVLRRRFMPGDRIELGENGRLPDGGVAAMYAVLVRPVRASATFDAVEEPTGAHWPVSVQVGDRYGLNFRHRTASRDAIRASYSILASDGTVVCTGTLDLPAAPVPDSWQIARIRTCASLNAGNYVLRVNLPADASGVVFDTLEVE